MKIGIIREGKLPTDARVTLSPKQCKSLMELYPQITIIVQPSSIRCFKDFEYLDQGIELREDVSDCDILLGVKEVPKENLVANKTYFFFSHTIKKQEHNRQLLQTILQKKIRLIDWETLTDNNGHRVIAFGRWAGIVGAHNAMMTWLQRIGNNNLKPLYLSKNLKEASRDYDDIKPGNIKIVLSGTGRVSSGCVEVLDMMNIRNVTPDEFLHETFEEPVYTQLNNSHLYYRSGDKVFDNMDYHAHAEEYKSKFLPFTKVSDVFINGIYWDKRIPPFFTKEDMKDPLFTIKTIADITCDIAPEASVPCTIRASTILAPVYGYHPQKERECDAFQPYSIDMMAVDNLPNELPRDASKNFGELFMEKIIPALLKDEDEMIERATIAKEGQLTEHFTYLSDYIAS
jgi:alanine dehydrogenase